MRWAPRYISESFYGYDLAGAFGSAILGDSAHWVHRLPGKLLHNNIDHLLNKLVEFLAEDAPAVVAHGSVRRATRYGDGRDAMVDELRLLVNDSGVTATGVFSAHVRPVGHFLRVYGTRGSLTADFVARTVTLDGGPRLPGSIGRLLPAFDRAFGYLREGGRNVLSFARSEFHFFAGLHHLIGAFYRSISEDAPPPISTRDMLRVASLMDAVFAQVPQGQSGS